jgi:excisionase family DNA binding protein
VAKDFGELLTVRQTVEYTGTSFRTIQSWLDSGLLASYITPGGKWRRIRKSEVDAILDEMQPHPGRAVSSRNSWSPRR